MRSRLWLIAAGWMLVCSWAALPANAQKAAETPAQQTERQLDEATRVDFSETPLQDVLKFLQDKQSVKIEFAPETMAGEKKVDPKALVTISVRSLSLRSALHLVLDGHGLEVTVKPDGTLLLIPSTKERKAARVESERQKAARARLQQKLVMELGNADFVNTPVYDVVTFLAVQADCAIVFDARALAKVSRDTPTTLLVPKEQPLNRLLQSVLTPFDLQAIVQDEVLLIVPRDPDAKTEPSAVVAAALATKIDIDLKQPLNVIAADLWNKTDVPFLLDSPALAKAGIDVTRDLAIQGKGVTPGEAIAQIKPALPLTLIEREGMVLISVKRPE